MSRRGPRRPNPNRQRPPRPHPTPDIDPQQLVETGRTGRPTRVREWEFTLAELMAVTTRTDWEGCYYRLRTAAANRLCEQLNQQKPWVAPTAA